VEHYVDLARRLLEEGFGVVLVGDTHDRWAADHFAGLGVADRLGTLTITGTLSVLRGASLVISHDTGPMHLARLVRAPLIAIFGPQLPSKHIPADDDATIFWGGAALACRPCYDPHEPARCTNNLCMRDVSVEQVMEAALARLRPGFQLERRTEVMSPGLTHAGETGATGANLPIAQPRSMSQELPA
jgi:heptosyltransferase-2